MENTSDLLIVPSLDLLIVAGKNISHVLFDLSRKFLELVFLLLH